MAKFDPVNIPETEARLEALRGKLAARKGKAEFKENVKALGEEIGRLEYQLNNLRRAVLASEEKPD